MLRITNTSRGRSRTARIVGTLAAVSLVAAACGSDDEPAADEEPAITSTDAPVAEPAADDTTAPEPATNDETSGGVDLADASVLVVPYWLDQFNTANTKWISDLLKAEGVGTVDVINPDKSASQQLNIIETAIASGNYDVIAWQPIDETLAVATIEKIQDAEIGQVVAFSSLQPGTDGLNFSGATVPWTTTYFDAGVAAGEYLQAHPELGAPKVAYANIFPPEQKCNDLLTSLVEGIESVTGEPAEIVYDEGATSQAEANSNLTDFITRGIDFNVYAGCGTTFDMGGFEAVRAAGLAEAVDNQPQDVYAASLDASPPQLEVLWNPELSMMNSVMFGPKSAAEAVVELVLNQLNGVTAYDESAEAAAELITLDTDCESGRAIVLEQFEGVDGFEVPDC